MAKHIERNPFQKKLKLQNSKAHDPNLTPSTAVARSQKHHASIHLGPMSFQTRLRAKVRTGVHAGYVMLFTLPIRSWATGMKAIIVMKYIMHRGWMA